MHRFSWDMHYDPIPGAVAGGRGGGGGGAAVPHRTYPSVNSPWVAPGDYTVRLTVNGQTQTQPITIKLDPRVKITPEVQQIFILTLGMEEGAVSATAAYQEARALVAKLKAGPQSSADLAKQIEEIAPEESPSARGGGGRGGRGGGGGFGAPEPAGSPTLASLGPQMIAAAMAMQGSEMPPTAAQIDACHREQQAYDTLMAKWTTLKASAAR